MPRFAVVRAPGSAWDRARPLREQDAWDEHATFMDALADEGFVVLGGPLGDDGRALLIIDAPSEADVEARLDADPWTSADMLRTVSIDRWTVLLTAPNRS